MTGTLEDWQPTRTSTAIVVLTTVVTAAVLANAAAVGWPAIAGAVGAVLLAVAIWMAGWERYQAIGAGIASLLVLPVGLGIVATTIGTILVLAGSLFPVSEAGAVPTTVIDMVARAMVVAGVAAAVFGAATATRGVLDQRIIEQAATTSIRTVVVPFLLWVGLALTGLLQFLEANDAGPGVATVVSDLLTAINEVFFQPDQLGAHLPTFLLMVGVALLAIQRGFNALPIMELLAGSGDGNSRRETVERVDSTLFWGGAAVLAAFPVATVVHLAVPPQQLRPMVGPGTYDVVAGVTTAPELRSLAWWSTVLGLATTLAVWLLRRVVQTANDRIGRILAPFAGGVVVSGVALVYAAPILATVVGWTGEQLPGEFGTEFTTVTENLVGVYGARTLVLGAVTAMIVLAASAVAVLWVVLAVRYVDERTAGITIASLALFNAAAFAGVLDVSNAVVLGALVAALLVWDAGEFGVTLGQEVGRRARTRRAELVHSTGTLAVGGVGVGVALLITERSVTDIGLGTGPVALGLLVVLGGLLLLVVALR